MKRIVLGALLALALSAPVGAQAQKLFEVWDMPSFMPGKMWIVMDLEAGRFVAAYRIEPYLSQTSKGFIQGSISGSTLSGDFYQANYGGGISLGTIRMEFDNSDASMSAYPADADGNALRSYTMPHLRAGDDSDAKTFDAIRSSVQDAVDEAFSD